MKAYLEKHFDEFESASLEELIKHALQALRDSIEKKQPGLSEKNCSVAVVGDGVPFVIHENGALTDSGSHFQNPPRRGQQQGDPHDIKFS